MSLEPNKEQKELIEKVADGFSSLLVYHMSENNPMFETTRVIMFEHCKETLESLIEEYESKY